MNTAAPPFPVVNECHYPAPSLVAAGHSCPQCDGSHDHAWVAWKAAPGNGAGGSVVGGMSGPGLAVRCRICGGRKCDLPACLLRRHHGGDHEWF